MTAHINSKRLQIVYLLFDYDVIQKKCKRKTIKQNKTMHTAIANNNCSLNAVERFENETILNEKPIELSNIVEENKFMFYCLAKFISVFDKYIDQILYNYSSLSGIRFTIIFLFLSHNQHSALDFVIS